MMLEIFKHAILDKRCLTGRHKGTERHFAPHAIGFKSDGTPAIFVFQYAGRTTTRLPPRGEWRCFDLADLSHLRVNNHRWRSAPNYSLSRQTCLAKVVLAVPEGAISS